MRKMRRCIQLKIRKILIFVDVWDQSNLDKTLDARILSMEIHDIAIFLLL